MKYGRRTALISPVAVSTRDSLRHSYQPMAGTRQRAPRKAACHIGRCGASSERALIVSLGGLDCFHHPGMKPHFMARACGPSGPAVITDSCMLGAAL
jgi:hypothetical protein